MISTKKLIIMARKWQKLAVNGRKRTLTQRTNSGAALGNRNGGSVAHKGHFVVYTTNERRFMIPLTYLRSNIAQELFRIWEEEFGISSDGHITVPIDALSMDYIISLTSRGVAAYDVLLEAAAHHLWP